MKWCRISSTALSRAVFITWRCFGIRWHLPWTGIHIPKGKDWKKNIMHQFQWSYEIFTCSHLETCNLSWKIYIDSVCIYLQCHFFFSHSTSILHSANKMFYVNFFYKNSTKHFHGSSVRRRFSRYPGGLTLLPLDFLKVSESPFLLKLSCRWKLSHFFNWNL